MVIVTRVVQGAQEIGQVANLLRLEIAEPLLDEVGDLVPRQGTLVDPHGRSAAEQNGHVSVRKCPRDGSRRFPCDPHSFTLDQLRDPPGEEVSLSDPRVLGLDSYKSQYLDARPVLGCMLRSSLHPREGNGSLVPEGRREEAVRKVHQLRPTPEILPQADVLADPLRSLQELDDEAHVGVPEAINRLLCVARGEEAVLFMQELGYLFLQRVRVLEFVQQDVPEAFLESGAHPFGLLQEIAG